MKRSAKTSTSKKAAIEKAAARKVTRSARVTPRKATPATALRTASGTKLTRKYEEQLAAEAEAGFDLAELSPRRAGRPSLTGRPGKSRRLDLRVDDDTFAAVQELAEREQRPVSDVVRDALRRYVEAS
jgi:Arc/MetJ family transcription regulator